MDAESKHPFLAFYEARLEQPLPDWFFNLAARIAHGFVATIPAREIRQMLETLRGAFQNQASPELSISKVNQARLLGHFAAVLVFIRHAAPRDKWAAISLKLVENKPERLKSLVDTAVSALLTSAPTEAVELL